MFDWKILAIATPLLFVTYQTLLKFLPKDTSVFLVNAYASLIGFLFMALLFFFTSPSKSLVLNGKSLWIALGIGLLISIGNYGVIKAYALGAPQSLFTLLFYVSLIIYGILFGLFIWHESLNVPQILGVALSVIGLLITLHFKK